MIRAGSIGLITKAGKRILNPQSLNSNRFSSAASILDPNNNKNYYKNRFNPTTKSLSLIPIGSNNPIVAQPSSLQSLSFSSLATNYAKKSDDDDKKAYHELSLSKKFKRMWKDYWYVLLPVHVATSVVWFGGFYFMCKSGVDVVGVLRSLGTSEAYLEKLSSSDVGYYALAYACYKIATPVRYTVTLGGTTFSIKYLSDLGYLKTTKELSHKMKERSEDIREKMEEKKDDIKEKYKDLNLNEIKEEFKEKYNDYKLDEKKKKEIRKKFQIYYNKGFKIENLRKEFKDKSEDIVDKVKKGKNKMIKSIDSSDKNSKKHKH